MPKSGFLDRVLGRIDKLDPANMQAVISRLARERDFLETLFNTIQDGILVLDQSGRLLYWNHAAQRMLGLHPDAEGALLSDWVPELGHDKLQPLRQGPAGGVLRLEFEVHFPRARFIRAYATTVENPGATDAGLLIILHDETDARQKTWEMVETERFHALTLLAATVAHEIGNPLNAIDIHLQLIERELTRLKSGVTAELAQESGAARVPRAVPRGRSGTGEPGLKLVQTLDRVLGFLQVTKGEIARLDYIIRQFLSSLRPMHPQFKRASVNEVVCRVAELLRPEIENRGLQLELKLGTAVPETKLDPDQIQQVLINLVKNAIHATTRGGVITIETGEDPEGVWFRVCDTGKGMSRDQVARLFEPFFTTRGGGTGLGLLVVQRVVRAHGGRIEVDSAPGRGTAVRVWLPLAERRPRLLESGSAPTDATPQSPAAEHTVEEA